VPQNTRNDHIAGTIRGSDGLPVAGVLVRAFTVRLRDEEPLGGEVATDPTGSYSISMGLPGGSLDGGGLPNVRVAVFDQAGHELATSPVHFGVEGAGAIDLTLPNGSNRVSEFERYVAALAPVLLDMSLADVDAADSAFLVGATGVPAEDLKALVDASTRAGEQPALPVEVYYAWHRQGVPLEPAALWQRSISELMDALRRAVEEGIVPAQMGDELDGIGARVEQLKLQHTGPSPGEAAPEEIRELPDVTIRVREPRPGFFEASFTPTDPLHIARNGYTLDTRRGLRGRTFDEVLDRAEANWSQNYPRSESGADA
jgi:hypothetical protein